jgi:prephenate dehydrogenase
MNDVAIVGLGLIGGSLALALSKRGFVVRATDSDQQQVARANAAGLQTHSDLHAALRQRPPHALVVCTPISTIAAVSKSYQESLRGSATLFFSCR